MRVRNLLKTALAASVAVAMLATVQGCSDGHEDQNPGWDHRDDGVHQDNHDNGGQHDNGDHSGFHSGDHPNSQY